MVVVVFGNFVFMVVGVCFVERMGWCKLLLISLVGVIFSLFIFGGVFYMVKYSDVKILVIEKVFFYIKNSCFVFGFCLDCLYDKCGFCFVKDVVNNFVKGFCIFFNFFSDNSVVYGRCS